MHQSYLMMAAISMTKWGTVTEFNRVWSGIKSQVRIMNALDSLGFTVLQPETKLNLDQKNLHGPDNEVYWWDLKAGVDFIAIKDGKAYLIDAKGQRYYSDGATTYTRGYKGLRLVSTVQNQPQKFQNLNKSLQNIMGNKRLDIDDIRSCTIIVPSPKFLSRDDSDPKRALTRLLSLDQQQIDEISKKLLPHKPDSMTAVRNRLQTAAYAN